MARSLEELQKQFNSVAPSKRGGMMGGPGPGPGGPRGHGRNRGEKAKLKNSKGTIKRILNYISVYKFRFVIVFFCMIVSTVGNLLGAYMLSPIIDNIAGTNINKSDIGNTIIKTANNILQPVYNLFTSSPVSEKISFLITGMICLAFVYVFAIAATYCQSKIMLHISQGSLQRIRNDLFDKIQTLPVRFHDTNATGETMSRFTNDVDNIGTMLDSSLLSLVSGVFTLAGTVFFMFYTNVILSLVTIIFVPLFMYLGGAIAKKSSKYYSAQQAALGAFNGYIEESVTGQKVVKVFNHEDENVEEFELLNNNLRDKQLYAQFFGGIMGPVMGNISKISYALVAGIGGI